MTIDNNDVNTMQKRQLMTIDNTAVNTMLKRYYAETTTDDFRNRQQRREHYVYAETTTDDHRQQPCERYALGHRQPMTIDNNDVNTMREFITDQMLKR